EKTSNSVIWQLFQGNVVNNGTPLTGSFNSMFRISAANPGPAYLQMKNNFENMEITKVTYNSNMANETGATELFRVYYKLSAGDWILFETFAPPTAKTAYEVVFDGIEGIVNIKFEISYSMPAT